MSYETAMQTLVLRIPDDLARELEAEAKKTHQTKSETARRLRLACRRGALRMTSLHEEAFIPVLDLLEKYADIPMNIADACLVRLTEILPDPLLLTTDSDFKIYRRLGRRVIPTRMP